jgi:hypothetical protein
MKNTILSIILCAGFMSCQKPTQIQIVNERADEKIYNYGLIDYYSDTGRIRNVEYQYVEYGEIIEILILGYRTVTIDENVTYETVDNLFVDRVKANDMSAIIELENCDKVEIRYFVNAYNNYYLNSAKIGTERIKFEKIIIQDKIKSGKVNKITIKD